MRIIRPGASRNTGALCNNLHPDGSEEILKDFCRDRGLIRSVGRGRTWTESVPPRPKSPLGVAILLRQCIAPLLPRGISLSLPQVSLELPTELFKLAFLCRFEPNWIKAGLPVVAHCAPQGQLCRWNLMNEAEDPLREGLTFIS